MCCGLQQTVIMCFLSVADNQEMVDCLRTIDAWRLVNRATVLVGNPEIPAWGTVIDGELIPEVWWIVSLGHSM